MGKSSDGKPITPFKGSWAEQVKELFPPLPDSERLRHPLACPPRLFLDEPESNMHNTVRKAAP